jgi:DNA-binding protein HU-beta
MTKTEFADRLHEKGYTKGQSLMIIDDFLTCIEEALVEGEEIRFKGFGVFMIRRRKAKVGRNPKDPDKEISIPARNMPIFKASITLRDAMNQ